ncbi:MAG: hypothetical protein GY750_20475 [Lentisphaerae bacterium]|nr:hypothetical protein [Lentisphaerota bacterium]
MKKRKKSLRAIYFSVLAILLTSISFFAVKIYNSPDNTFDPFCTYSSQYTLKAILKVGNEILHSTINRQRSFSRPWIQVINSNGCKQSYGTALSFRSSDNRAFLISSNICPLAEEVLLEIGEADIIKLCTDTTRGSLSRKWGYKIKGYIISDAETPKSWRKFNPLSEEFVVLKSMKAIQTEKPASDDLDKLMPNILRTGFDANGSWSESPEPLLSFGRRNSLGIIYSAKKRK